ncbi:lysosome membrane protein 2 [Thecamonas trahens ATCC 50062]|uniref:Lysosome membrane protein 2 n=1 Tax=Thecamonas trahens ATCC 50062 TaxID=461836 RepID=A0A0L0DAE5_THETB|nr:lysosome membrane protein 2 [Thecamonas trahens ATCC 50062]KNC48268.1 lysosome membrane protein 2 [Thecamonas trahens ATCC 50062]|eukprot:XP_013758835.1 lysosome membrane protein 2 [Thecamonas trahens ATCC 50062]
MHILQTRRKAVGITACVAGLLLIAAATTVYLLIPYLVQKKINDAVVIDSPNSSGYDNWVSSYHSGNSELQSYTFFNLTNAPDVLAGAAPVFEPVGPFVYRRNTVKLDPKFLDGGARVSFKEMSQYSFVPEQSIYDQLDKVLLTNYFPFYQAAVNKAGSEKNLLYGFLPTLLSITLSEIGGHLGNADNTTAAMIQWGSLGITGANLPSLPSLELRAPPVRNISLDLAATHSLLFGASGLISDETAVTTFLGLLARQDIGSILAKWPELGTPDNVLTLAAYFEHLILVRGLDFAEQVFFQGGRGTGLIVTHTVEQWLWQYEDPLLAALDPSIAHLAHLQFNDTSANITRATKRDTITATGKGNLAALNTYLQWNGLTEVSAYTPPGPVRGTNGHSFGPDIRPPQPLEVFVSEIQRPLQILHVRDTKVKGIEVFEYRLNPAELQPNEQYVSPVYGLFNIEPISHGIPLEISKPFFLNADPELARAAGLTPDYGRDSTFLDVEPMTGVAFRASLKLQINTRINSNLTQVFFPHAASGVWPLLAIHRDGIISDSDADSFKRTIRAALIGAKVGFGIGLTLGILSLALAAYLAFRPACGSGVPSGGYDDLDAAAASGPAGKREDAALMEGFR